MSDQPSVSADDLALCPLCKHPWTGHEADRAVDAVHCRGRDRDGQECGCVRSTCDRPRVFVRYAGRGPTGLLWRVSVGVSLEGSQHWLTFNSWRSAIRSVDFVLRH